MKKKIIILVSVWLAGAILLAIASNYIYLGVMMKMMPDIDMISKYAKYGEYVTDPHFNESPEFEDKRTYLSLREMLDDAYVDIPNLGYTYRACKWFIRADGDMTLSKGSWLCVVEEAPERKQTLIKNAIGLVSVDEMSTKSYASELLADLETNLNANVRMDKYAANGIVIIPLKITLTDENGNELATVESDEVVSGEYTISEEPAYIINFYTDVDGEYDNADFSLYEILKDAMNGPSNVDIAMEELVKKVDFSQGNNGDYKHFSLGIGNYKIQYINIEGDYAMVGSEIHIWPKNVILTAGLVDIAWTVIMAIVSVAILIIRNKKQKNMQ